MDQFSNIILTAIFAALAVWLFYGYVRTRGLIYKDKLWSWSRIFFLVAGAVTLLSAFVYTSVLDWIRLGSMLLCVVGFFLTRDGIREDGFAISGRFYPFANVHSYDYGNYKDQFRIYFVMEGESFDAPNILTLPSKQKDEIIAFLKNKMGKKYTRMKKG
ncbi:MAG: hypothetical protein IKF60_02110 [Solobacterium sp.]|nr:hypothetical protein [Solobacterium sp.]